jgi:Prion-inhibition and propagation
MAEFTGLSIGSVALAGLFNNCVDTFQCIQLGRNFGNDYESCLVKLDVVKLRFLRWGELITVQDGVESQNLRSAASPQGEEIAERLLGQILSIFERAKQTSQTFQTIGKPKELIVDTQPQRGNLAALHDHLQKNTETVQRTSEEHQADRESQMGTLQKGSFR